MADSAQNRNLPATERKIRKAREEGQVARSRDLAHVAMVGGCGAAVVLAMPVVGDWLLRILRTGLVFDAALLARPDVLTQRLAELTWGWMAVLLPLGGVALLLALASGLAVGGWNFTWKPLAPTFTKLNPLNGLRQMVSGQRLADLGKACLLALVLFAVGGAYLAWRWPLFHDALAMPLPVALVHTGQAMATGLGLLCVALAVFAAADVPLQRFLLQQRLRMTLDEVKQEQKETEGSPEVRSRVRQRMREMARRRMLAAVPTADLVVTNPSHFSVALKYDEAVMGAPRVVAKGADLLAFKIREIAQANRVPVLEAPPLARALYAHTEIDQEIPVRLFSAVAQVLAYVYQLKRAMAGQAPWPAQAPEPEVPPDLDPLNTGPDAAPGAAADRPGPPTGGTRAAGATDPTPTPGGPTGAERR